ncbi:MAG TPA: hypothetical protein VEC16_05355, partial [Alphaproteobacteria bacterium]|nr:hypothetical protein [Alphaproteobacteria bacterium]
MINKIFDPKNFLIVHHRALNNSAPRLDDLAEKTYQLEKNISGRKAIMALEGDIIEHKDDIYFCHDITKRELDWFSEAKHGKISSSNVGNYMR